MNEVKENDANREINLVKTVNENYLRAIEEWGNQLKESNLKVKELEF